MKEKALGVRKMVSFWALVSLVGGRGLAQRSHRAGEAKLSVSALFLRQAIPGVQMVFILMGHLYILCLCLGRCFCIDARF